MSSLKILMLSARKPPLICGVGDYTHNLSEGLRQQGVQVEHLAGRRGAWLLLRVLFRLYLKKYDWVHLQYEPFSFLQSYLLPLALAFLPIKLVVTFHEVFQRNRLQRLRDCWLAQAADILITTDAQRAQDLSQLSLRPIDEIQILGVGSNIPPLKKPSKSIPGLIGFFGFLNGVKGSEALIRVFSALHQRNSASRLRMIGDISKDSAEFRLMSQKFRELGLTESVEWTGPLGAADISAKISECELMLLPFLDGASPRRGSLQACMTLGKAVITTPPKAPEPSLDGLTFIPAESTDQWIESASQILQNESERRRLEEVSHKISRAFGWDTISSQHLRLYLKNH